MSAPFLLAAALFATGASANPTIEDVLPGPRAQAMGGAFTSLADDANGLLYNPAAMAGAPDLELGTSLQRLYGPPSPLAGVYLGYGRPIEAFPTGDKAPAGSAIGAAYYAERWSGVANKDTILLNYGSKWNGPLPTPIKWGVSTRFVDLGETASHLGFGVDGGVLFDGPGGVKFGAALTEVMIANISDLDTPTFALGANYTFANWVLGAVDFRTRPGRTVLEPGTEFKLLSGLLRLRAGLGLDWAGVDQFAFGFGVNYSPVVLDFAFTVPPEGLNRDSGAYQVGFSYKFGAPPFYADFIGDAAEAAAKLKAQIQDLTNQKTLLEQDLAREQASKAVLRTDLASLQSQLDETRAKARELDENVAERKNAPPPPRPLPPPHPSWPRRHTVSEGDTLRSIALKYYGDPTDWEAIYKANADKIDRGLPRVGSELVIPAPGN